MTIDNTYQVINQLIYETVRAHLADIPRLRHYEVEQLILSTLVDQFEIMTVPKLGMVRIYTYDPCYYNSHQRSSILFQISILDQDFDRIIARALEHLLDKSPQSVASR